MTLRIALIPAVLLAASSPALAQNRFFDDETTGLTLEAGWVSSDDASGPAIGGDLTILANLDLGLSYVAPKLKQGLPDMNWDEFTPRVAFALARPTVELPLGADLAVSYTFLSYRGRFAETVDGNKQTIGIDAYACLGDTPAVKLLPTLGVHYARVTGWFQPDGESARLEETTEALLLGVELGLHLRKRIVIKPAMTLFDGETTLAITIGTTVPFV